MCNSQSHWNIASKKQHTVKSSILCNYAVTELSVIFIMSLNSNLKIDIIISANSHRYKSVNITWYTIAMEFCDITTVITMILVV